MSEGVQMDLRQMERIEKVIRKIGDAGKTLEKPLKEWGIYMLGQTNDTFVNGGRGSVVWPPLSEMTLAMRKASGKRVNPRRMLQATGLLKKSIKTEHFKRGSTDAQTLFTRVPYARIHQDGGTVTLPARATVPEAERKQAKVPQRQFLFILRGDERHAARLFIEHARKAMPPNVRR